MRGTHRALKSLRAKFYSYGNFHSVKRTPRLSAQQSIAAGSEVTVSLPKTIQRARLTCALLDADSKQNRDANLPALFVRRFLRKKIFEKKACYSSRVR
jgi:hypothetical protein